MNSATVETEVPRDSASPRRVGLWLPVWTLTQRELVRFFRQRTRVIGALGQPLLFWVLFGAGLRTSFQPPEWAPRDMSYQEYFFPGVAVMIVLFTAIFSTISIIEDRREGFLQGVLVAPISRLSLVLGKLCGGSALAVLQAGLFLLFAPWMGISFTPVSAALVLAFLTLIAFALTGLGFLIAWPMDSTQGFHAIMSIFLLPMWLLSGSFFPGGDRGWLSWIIRVNPLTYGVAGLRRLLYWHETLPATPSFPSLPLSVAVTCAFCAACIAVAVLQTQRRTSRDAR
jgi:ABC-2 type transport system permease protein